MLEEIAKLERLRSLNLPPDRFRRRDGAKSYRVIGNAQRAEESYELRRHPQPLRTDVARRFLPHPNAGDQRHAG